MPGTPAFSSPWRTHTTGGEGIREFLQRGGPSPPCRDQVRRDLRCAPGGGGRPGLPRCVRRGGVAGLQPRIPQPAPLAFAAASAAFVLALVARASSSATRAMIPTVRRLARGMSAATNSMLAFSRPSRKCARRAPSESARPARVSTRRTYQGRQLSPPRSVRTSQGSARPRAVQRCGSCLTHCSKVGPPPPRRSYRT